MNLENLIAVSGLPGLYRLAANRSNGLIIEEIKSGKRRFASSRKHQFTPLESIAIYTDDGESMELKHVFRNMYDQLEDNPPIGTNSSSEDLHDYFEDVLPNYDKDRVFTGDIKKVIKWFNYLKESNLLTSQEEETDKHSPGEEEE
jgi:hypothetical protein